MTRKQLIDDIELELLQGAVSDDSELSKSQIAYWLDVNLNALVANECNEKKKRGQLIPAIYIIKESIEAGEFEEDDLGDQNRVFFELDGEVLNVNQGGVIRITVDDGTEVKKASVESLNLFNAMRFAKPSENNLIYTQEGSKIYVEGLQESDIPFDSIHVWYVPKQDILNAADSYEVLVSDLTLPILIDACVQQGKQMLYGTQLDKANDGQPGIEPVYHRQIANNNAQA